jgi:hypothetical protein
MKGYGLTVFEGVKIVRFDVEIVSVMTRWGPHQDVVLARLSGHDLDKTGIIAGMSGSPVYITDSDGKDKLIGAVAYGFRFQKEPLCGIQPIVQMLAGSGMFSEATSRPTSAPAVAAGAAPDDYLKTVLNPAKVDFAELAIKRHIARTGGAQEPSASRLSALGTPLMIAGASERTLRHSSGALAAMGMIPVQSGGAGASTQAVKAQLVPGSAVAVPLVSGDCDLSAVGTVTEVIDGRVLAFGHSFFGDGEISLPMGNGYVHTTISSIVSSFKLASPLDVVGALTNDEEVAISGKLGAKAEMIPMSVKVNWSGQSRVQSMKYELCRHRFFTPMLVRMMVVDAALGWRQLPEHHTLRYSVKVDLGKDGQYAATNVSSDNDIYDVVSDVGRPVMALLENPLGPAPQIKNIEVEIEIVEGCTSQEIMELRLDGSVYKPGETIKGTLLVQPFRRERLTLPVQFELPADVKEGRYTLTACDNGTALSRLRSEMPQRFDPRTVAQLVQTLQRVVEPRADHLFLRLNMDKGGLAIKDRELPNLPPSKAGVLREAASSDGRYFTAALVREVAMGCPISGSAQAQFEVRTTPRETVTHK